MCTRRLVGLAAAACIIAVTISCASTNTKAIAPAPVEASRLEALCRPEAVQGIASRLSTTVNVQPINDGPRLPGGVRYVAAANGLAAYCQVTGSFVTNPVTGKTSNFLAAFPANWNGKYLQVGCSGHCGNFYVNDVTLATITITNQGRPGEAVRRGYAAFATDEGHEGMAGGSWAIKADGVVDQDFVDDFLFRAQRVLSDMGKEFTTAFYAEASGADRAISYSYFSGCSGGGRDALVAASYFPEQFDGIIAGSPYTHMSNLTLHAAGATLAHIRSADADVTPAMFSRVDAIVMAQCDPVDGVQDGLIQNPAACNFRPERDLPRCEAGRVSDQCFTQAQIETVSAYITGATDERGVLVQPGFSVSNIQTGMRLPPPADLNAIDPWPTAASAPSGPSGGIWGLADANIRIFAHRADPSFRLRSIFTLRDGGPGEITSFRTIVPRAEVDLATEALRNGIGVFPENADRLMRSDSKMLIWSNLSDQLLTPFGTANYYNALAERNGGFSRLQRNVRLFGLPGTVHCSMGGVGVNSFDALGAMEAWVERGEAPNALIASQFPSRQDPAIAQVVHVDYDAPPQRTMPLCMYPQMARYSGLGNVNDAANWTCPADDRRMLTVSESGRRAGVIASGAR